MHPERGEGCRCKGKTPKTFYLVSYTYKTELFKKKRNNITNNNVLKLHGFLINNEYLLKLTKFSNEVYLKSSYKDRCQFDSIQPLMIN